jgi:hypothetical protein
LNAVSETIADETEGGTCLTPSDWGDSVVEVADGAADLAGGGCGDGISLAGVTAEHDGSTGETASVEEISSVGAYAACPVEGISHIGYIASKWISRTVGTIGYTGGSASIKSHIESWIGSDTDDRRGRGRGEGRSVVALGTVALQCTAEDACIGVGIEEVGRVASTDPTNWCKETTQARETGRTC